jgi:hypothetical protein
MLVIVYVVAVLALSSVLMGGFTGGCFVVTPWSGNISWAISFQFSHF